MSGRDAWFPHRTRTELEALATDARDKLGRVDADIEAIKSEMASRLSGLNDEAQKLRTQLGQVNSEIARREARDAMVPTISDHALLRYIARVHGIDTDAMKAALLTEKLVAAIMGGATGMRTPDGTFVINGSTVVTFLAPEMNAKRRTKRGLVEEGWDFDLVTDEAGPLQ
jgi:hypothetical protein